MRKTTKTTRTKTKPKAKPIPKGVGGRGRLGSGRDDRTTARMMLEKKRRHQVSSKAQQQAVQMELSDIEFILGDMHEVRNPARRERCRLDLEAYLREYRPRAFSRPFSVKHRRFIQQLEQAMFESIWLVKSMPRGFGKTTLVEGAVEWAVSYGHKRFIRILGASEKMGEAILQSISQEFEQNDAIDDDFPEIAHAVRALQGKYAQRQGVQKYKGNLTGIRWGGGRLIFPTTIPDMPSAGSMIDAMGWSGGIRGSRQRRPDGLIVRPDFCMVDDPQDDEMAASPASCQKFLDILQGTILGLGGHDTRISVVMPATIIKPGDAIDQMMDPQEYPAWISENIPMLETEPTNQDVWLGEYARIRADYDRGDPKAQKKSWAAATKFYQTNRARMDEGAIATWEECFQSDEISAIQHAMNIKIDRGNDYFMAECQGRPSQRLGSGALVTSADFISAKISGTPQHTIGPQHQLVTGFVDVGHDKLNWMICAWTPTMTGTIIDYGEWPEGQRKLTDIEPRLTAAVFSGLVSCIENMAGAPINCTSPGGSQALRVSTLLIDCGDPTTRETVFTVARAQRFPCRVIASRGRAHHQFYISDPKKKRVLQSGFVDVWKNLGLVVVHDACLWRERLQRAMMLPAGSQGGVDIFGVGRDRHRELATQLCSERLVEKFAGQSGEMFKWVRVPGTRNHFLDCAVGNMVAATTEGVRYGIEENRAQGKQSRTTRQGRDNDDEQAERPQQPARRRGRESRSIDE